MIVRQQKPRRPPMRIWRQNIFKITKCILILLNVILVAVSKAEDRDNGNDSDENGPTRSKMMRVKGDIILGGIFPLHEQLSATNNEYPCGAVKEEKGIQRLEAMLFAIDKINRDPKILPNVSLGVLIIDSCSSETYALEQSMEFVRYYMNKVGFLNSDVVLFVLL